MEELLKIILYNKIGRILWLFYIIYKVLLIIPLILSDKKHVFMVLYIYVI